MSSIPHPADVPPDLLALRAELDRLDDALHDTLMRRAAVVEQVGHLSAKGPVALRPGREASILRRLLARHTGRFPPSRLVQMWREMLSGTTAMQGPFVLAVCAPDLASGYIAAAREHFGAQTPLRVHRTPAQAIGAVSSGACAVAVLPMPAEDEPASAAWWTALLHRDDPRIHIVAKLPFWAPRPEGVARPVGAGGVGGGAGPERGGPLLSRARGRAGAEPRPPVAGPGRAGIRGGDDGPASRPGLGRRPRAGGRRRVRGGG